MLNQLFGCGGMRQGGHHLYDEILGSVVKDEDFD